MEKYTEREALMARACALMGRFLIEDIAGVAGVSREEATFFIEKYAGGEKSLFLKDNVKRFGYGGIEYRLNVDLPEKEYRDGNERLDAIKEKLRVLYAMYENDPRLPVRDAEENLNALNEEDDTRRTPLALRLNWAGGNLNKAFTLLATRQAGDETASLTARAQAAKEKMITLRDQAVQAGTLKNRDNEAVTADNAESLNLHHLFAPLP